MNLHPLRIIADRFVREESVDLEREAIVVCSQRATRTAALLCVSEETATRDGFYVQVAPLESFMRHFRIRERPGAGSTYALLVMNDDVFFGGVTPTVVEVSREWRVSA